MTIIRCQGIGKQYRIGRREKYRSLRDTVTRALDPHTWWRKKRASEVFWALRDVSFDVGQGEVLGIIGRNGAGKSTLLKILSRITEPTTGTAEIRGRVGSLLEVGTGFHPELTGRENIYLNGAILGMSRAEISRNFDAIVAFAQIEKFLDTQVKHYSSGMYMRLAFAVAAHLEPEVLIIDEVLAVGDAEFQKRSLSKMGEVASSGRTVLFVSHNLPAIRSLCTRALWLDEGKVVEAGAVDAVIHKYASASFHAAAARVWDTPEQAPGNDHIRLRSVLVRRDNIDVPEPIAIEIQYWNLIPDSRLNLSVSVFNDEDACVFTTVSANEPAWHGKKFPAGLFQSSFTIPGWFLNAGRYRLRVLFVTDATYIVAYFEDAMSFNVEDTALDRGGWHGRWLGVTRPRLQWETTLIDPAEAGASQYATVSPASHS